MDVPLFDNNNFYNKNNYNSFDLNNGLIFDKIPITTNFRNDIKLFSDLPQYKTIFNNNDIRENKNIINYGQNNILNNVNSIRNNINENTIDNKNQIDLKNNNNKEIKNGNLKINSIDLPNFPSFFNDNNETLNKTNNNLININNNNSNKINLINNYSNIKINNGNIFNDLVNIKEHPIFKNFLENNKQLFDNFISPRTFSDPPLFTSSLKNNLIINPRNNNFYNFPFDIRNINNVVNKNRNENDLLNNNNLIGKKRF